MIYAPQDNSAKEIILLCILAALVAAPLAVAAPFLGGPWDGDALERFLTLVFERKPPGIGIVFQVAALVLAGVSILAFSLFVRLVAARFEHRFLARNV